jgi:transcriptional regulator with XRE-family HTH domain
LICSAIGAKTKQNKTKQNKKTRTRVEPGMSDPLDAHIAAKIRAKRLALGVSQDDFATLVGIEPARFLQVENGMERLFAAEIAEICKALDTQVAWFFDDAPPAGPGGRVPAFPTVDYAFTSPDRQRLTDNFDRLPRVQQQQLVNLSSELIAAIVVKARTCR